LARGKFQQAAEPAAAERGAKGRSADLRDHAAHAELLADLEPSDKIPLPRDRSSDNESYAQIIARAIWAHPDHVAQTKELYTWIYNEYPRFHKGPRYWKNSIRHTLSKYNCFVRKETDTSVSWTLNPKLLMAANGGMLALYTCTCTCAPARACASQACGFLFASFGMHAAYSMHLHPASCYASSHACMG